MADTVAEAVNATLNATLSNATVSSLTPEQQELCLYVAYSALILMASLCVYVGSMRSLREKTLEEQAEVMTTKEAAMFPVYASGFLFGMYLIFKFFGKEYINMLLTVYFFVLGVLGVASVLAPLLRPQLGLVLTEDQLEPFHLRFTKGVHHHPAPADATDAVAVPKAPEELFDLQFDYSHVAGTLLACVLGGWYLYEKHWVANNVFGMCFAINGIELLALGSYQVGCILLGGLFFYDIFWVFGTDVMVTVARSFEAPIKVLFPKDILEHLWRSKSFTMLGLGDIVIPGIFIALLLRFDRSQHKGAVGTAFPKPYFNVAFVCYVLGLLFTVTVMHVYKAAQPALLYLVPACILSSSITALVRGEMKQLLQYSDSPEEEPKPGQDAVEAKKDN